MKIIYNRFIPFKGFFAINLFGILFVKWEKGKPKPYVSPRTINHESIHTEQMKELGYIFFYILYILEWIVRLFVDTSNAYRNISFEQEASIHEDNPYYLRTRKHYNWVNYL